MVGTIFLDTNVILDLVTDDPHWKAWSLRQIEAAAMKGGLAIDPVVYAELSVRYPTIAAVERLLDEAAIQLVPTPRPALFLAGKIFQRYRASGGTRSGVLPDFFVGAHAAVTRSPLISRDARRYKAYFPSVTLITPRSTAS